FFFSSRRRHTRFSRDWSSDVCSSDLDRKAVAGHIGAAFDWAKAEGLPPTRVVAAEFGCMRLWADCGTYLADVMDAVEERGGHWRSEERRGGEQDSSGG